MASQIGTLGNLPNLVVGGQTFVNTIPVIGTPIVLLGAAGGASSNYTTFRKMNGSAGYQVTSGKTLTIYAVSFSVTNPDATGWTIGYGSSDIGVSAASAPTSPFYAGNTTNNFIGANGVAGLYSVPVLFTIAQNLYPFVYNTSTHSVSHIIFGYEA